MTPLDGILALDKPAGMTSHDVVARVRRALKTKRVGHAGTLDPDATGVLVVAVGQATRLLPHMDLEPKEYVARAVFGVATASEDASGEVIAEADASGLTEEALRAALPRFVGEIDQIPPMVSAVHHEGRRLYELAREGKVVEREPRRVRVFSIALSEFVPGERAEATLRVSCGGGTYIRTLCFDIGAALGLPAHMKTLVREAVGPFRLSEDVVPLDKLGECETAAAPLLPMVNALPWMPRVEVSEEGMTRLLRGMPVAVGADRELAEDAEVALLSGGRLVALARSRDGLCHPFKVLAKDGDG